MTDFKEIIAKASTGLTLSETETESAFDTMMSGNATAAQIGALLMALRIRGETVDEITAAARVMRSKAEKITAPDDAVDTCGTGGDGSGTYNISSAAALVVAACGVPVAKHGNKAASSKSGAADVLAQLGVNINCPIPVVEQCIGEAGIGFLFAPKHHGAMRHVGPVRGELGIRTIFNLLGPLSNPAGAKRQLLGVFDAFWVEPMAQVLQKLGSERVWVVHGSDGLDEITTTGTTKVAALNHSDLSTFEIDPQDFGIPLADPQDLVGGEPAENAQAITALFDGETGAYRDIVLINSGAALIVAGKADNLGDGIAHASEAIDSGQARETLAKLVEVSNR
ncbi:MAG: anthranilate phosphoribosyltransferase [Alphaproteobacteria bacterium]